MSIWIKGPAVAAAGLALVFLIPAASPKSDAGRGRTCFLSRNVESWAPQGIDAVNIKVHEDYFRLNLAEACPEIQEADRIKLAPRGGGTSLICLHEAANAEVTAFSKVTGPRRCLVRDIVRLTPTEVASLSKREKP
ncbi:MAG TPA: hypothetical protein VFN88_13155 [Caulobacteraceae bacterium]|nr:hypothetical protein [Caulobacteraceae bacterium]